MAVPQIDAFDARPYTSERIGLITGGITGAANAIAGGIKEKNSAENRLKELELNKQLKELNTDEKLGNNIIQTMSELQLEEDVKSGAIKEKKLEKLRGKQRQLDKTLGQDQVLPGQDAEAPRAEKDIVKFERSMLTKPKTIADADAPRAIKEPESKGIVLRGSPVDTSDEENHLEEIRKDIIKRNKDYIESLTYDEKKSVMAKMALNVNQRKEQKKIEEQYGFPPMGSNVSWKNLPSLVSADPEKFTKQATEYNASQFQKMGKAAFVKARAANPNLTTEQLTEQIVKDTNLPVEEIEKGMAVWGKTVQSTADVKSQGLAERNVAVNEGQLEVQKKSQEDDARYRQAQIDAMIGKNPEYQAVSKKLQLNAKSLENSRNLIAKSDVADKEILLQENSNKIMGNDFADMAIGLEDVFGKDKTFAYSRAEQMGKALTNAGNENSYEALDKWEDNYRAEIQAIREAGGDLTSIDVIRNNVAKAIGTKTEDVGGVNIRTKSGEVINIGTKIDQYKFGDEGNFITDMWSSEKEGQQTITIKMPTGMSPEEALKGIKFAEKAGLSKVPDATKKNEEKEVIPTKYKEPIVVVMVGRNDPIPIDDYRLSLAEQRKSSVTTNIPVATPIDSTNVSSTTTPGTQTGKPTQTPENTSDMTNSTVEEIKIKRTELENSTGGYIKYMVKGSAVTKYISSKTQ